MSEVRGKSLQDWAAGLIVGWQDSLRRTDSRPINLRQQALDAQVEWLERNGLQ
jgi:hypothetical protein